MREQLKLGSEDKNNPLWIKLKKHLEKELQRMRDSNDADLDEKKTAMIRGRIAQIKDLLALDKPVTTREADDVLAPFARSK